MKNLFKKIKRCNRDIEDVQSQMANIERLPYYEIFGTETERQKDLNTCRLVMQDYIKEKYTYLENLQLEIEKEKNRLSQEQKIYTLLKT